MGCESSEVRAEWAGHWIRGRQSEGPAPCDLEKGEQLGQWLLHCSACEGEAVLKLVAPGWSEDVICRGYWVGESGAGRNLVSSERLVPADSRLCVCLCVCLSLRPSIHLYQCLQERFQPSWHRDCVQQNGPEGTEWVEGCRGAGDLCHWETAETSVPQKS